MVESTMSEIDELAEKAHTAFLTYRHAQPSQKINFLNGIADSLDKERVRLITIASKETNLPYDRLEGEYNRTINQLRQFSDLLKQGTWVRAIINKGDLERKPLPKPDLR